MKACKKEYKNLVKNKQTTFVNVKQKEVPEWFDKNIEKQETTLEEQEKLRNLLSNYN